MLDSVNNLSTDGKASDKTAWHDELSENRTAALKKINSTDINKADGSNLLFSPEYYPNGGFKPGPYTSPKMEFVPYAAKKSDRLIESATIKPDSLEVRAPRSRPADAVLSREQKAALHDLTDFKFPTSAGDGMKTLQKSVAGFVAERDKKAALPKYKEQFLGGIAASDNDFFKTEKTQAPAIGEAQINYKLAISQFAESNKNLNEQIAELPKKMQAEAKGIKSTLETVGDSAKLAKQLNTDFKNYPDFIKTVAQFNADGSRFGDADNLLTAARKPIIDAAREEVYTRLIVMKAATAGGDPKMAAAMADEAKLMAIRAVEIENKAKPNPASLQKI